jgi:hypothetical protein
VQWIQHTIHSTQFSTVATAVAPAVQPLAGQRTIRAAAQTPLHNSQRVESTSNSPRRVALLTSALRAKMLSQSAKSPSVSANSCAQALEGPAPARQPSTIKVKYLGVHLSSLCACAGERHMRQRLLQAARNPFFKMRTEPHNKVCHTAKLYNSCSSASNMYSVCTGPAKMPFMLLQHRATSS